MLLLSHNGSVCGGPSAREGMAPNGTKRCCALSPSLNDITITEGTLPIVSRSLLRSDRSPKIRIQSNWRFGFTMRFMIRKRRIMRNEVRPWRYVVWKVSVADRLRSWLRI